MTRLSPLTREAALTVVGSLLLMTAGCSRDGRTEVLAEVGDKAITVEDFSRHLEARRARSAAPMEAKELLNELVEREILVQRAVESGLMEDWAIQEKIRDVLIASFKERTLSPRTEKVSLLEEELAAAYEKRKMEFAKPEQVRVALLFAQAERRDKEAVEDPARLRLEAAAQLARQQDARNVKGQPMGFGPLAVQHSEDQESRYRGGEIGWVEKERFPGRLDPAVIAAAFALHEPGQISEVIDSPKGYYVVKLLERRQATVMPLNEVEPALRSSLMAEKQAQAVASFQNELRQGLRIVLHSERLAHLAVAESAASSPPSSLP